MYSTLSLFLFVFAIVLLIVAGAIGNENPWRGRLSCFGLACFAGAEMFSRTFH